MYGHVFMNFVICVSNIGSVLSDKNNTTSTVKAHLLLKLHFTHCVHVCIYALELKNLEVS